IHFFMGLPQVSIAGIEIRHSIKQGASQGLRSLFIETYDDLDRRGRHHEVSELSSLSSASSEAEWSSSAREEESASPKLSRHVVGASRDITDRASAVGVGSGPLSAWDQPSIPFFRSSEGGLGPSQIENTASAKPFPSKTPSSLVPAESVVPFPGR